MGTTLTGKVISATYDALLKVTDNDNITSTAKRITDGLGNDTPLYISTTRIGIGVSPTTTFHVSGNSQIGGNLTVTGDLLVEGSTTTIDTETLSVEDPLIIVGSNNTTSDAVDLGIYGVYDTSGSQNLYAGIFRRAADNKFHIFRDLQTEPTTTVNLSGTGYTVATLVGNVEGTLTGIIASSTTATTQSANDNSTKVATTEYVDSSAGNYLPLAGGTMSGNIAMGSNNISGGGTATFTSFVGDLTGNADTATNATNADNIALTADNVNTNRYVPFTATANGDGTLLTDAGLLYNSFNNTLTTTTFSGQLNGTISSATTATTQTQGDNSTKVATTAYVDTAVGDNNELSEVLANGNTTGGTDIAVSAGDDITFTDTSKAYFGAGNDLQIFHDGSDSFVQDSGIGDFYVRSNSTLLLKSATTTIQAYGSSETIASFNENGAVELYYDNSKKFETTSTGISVTGRISNLTDPSNAQDAATKAYVDSQVGANNELSEVLANGNTTGGTDISVSSGDDITFADDSKTIYGAGSDLQIYHDNSTNDSIIKESGAGHLKLLSNFISLKNVDDTETMLSAEEDGSVSLYFNNVTKLSTSNLGVTLNGNLFLPQGDYISFNQGAPHNHTIERNGNDLEFNTGGDFVFLSGQMKLDTYGSGTYTGTATYRLAVDSSGDVIEIPIGDGAVDGSGAAGQVAFWTDTDTISGENNLYWDSTNDRLGIGAAPSNKLHIQQAKSGSSAENYDLLRFNLTGTGAIGDSSSIVWYSTSGTKTAGIEGISGQDNILYGELAFNVRKYTTDSFDEAMRINNRGNVGIGTDSPSATLELNSTTGNAAKLRVGRQTTATNYLELGTNGGDSVINAIGIAGVNATLVFNRSTTTTTTESMRINGSGNVGIGTDSPTYKFEVSNGTVTGTFNPNSSGFMFLGSTSNHPLYFGVNDSTKMIIDTSGNVGIGTTNPQENLHIADASDGVPVFRLEGGSRTYQQFVSDTKFYIRDVTASSNRIVLDSSGNTTFTGDVTVNNDGDGKITIGGASGLDIIHNNAGNTIAEIKQLYASTSASAQMKLTSGFTTFHTGTSGTERMRIDSSGRTSIIGVFESPTSEGILNLKQSSGVGSLGMGFYDGGTNPHFWLQSRSYSNYSTTYNLALQPTGGNVGIGTTSPLTTLDLGINGGQKFYVYANGDIRSGMGIDLSGSSRELSIFTTSSNGSDGDISFGYRLESNGSYNERMRLTSAGNLGIGTTSPDAIFHVAKTNSGGIGGQIVIDNPASSTLGNSVEISFLTDAGASGTNTRNARILAVNENAGNGAANMQFHTWDGSTSAERMRITSGGKVGIETTSPVCGLDVRSISGAQFYNESSTESNSNIRCRHEGAETSSDRATQISFRDDDDNEVGSIKSSGSATFYNTSSDYRLKQNEKDFNGLDLVDNIKVYDFEWKKDGGKDYGVFAHELQEVVPEAVSGEKDGEEMQSVDYSRLVPILLKSIQELKQEIEILKNN